MSFETWYDKYPDTTEYVTGMRDAYEAGRAESEAQIAALRKALDLSATRLEICVGRMRGCNDKPQTHELLDEVVGWVIEAREALSTPASGEPARKP